MDTSLKNISEHFTEKETLELLAELVSCPSHDGVENRETETAKHIYGFFIREGMEAEIIPVQDGRCNVVAKLAGTGGGRSILFTGHTDTVPPYDMPEPYDAKIIDGKMYGRGVVDMKGGLACMMMAMAAIKRAGIQLSGDIIFAALIDEEETSLGTRAWLRDCRELPDAAIVSEPSNMQICTGHRGLEWFEFTFHGKTVHGGRQKDGINAIQKASMFIQRMEKDLIPRMESRTPHPVIGSPTMNYGFIKGGTQPSTVAGECILQLDRRWIPGESYQGVLGEFQQILDELTAEDSKFKANMKVMDISYMDDQYVHEPMDTALDDPIVRTAKKVIEDVTEDKAVFCSFPAWSDGGLINYYGKVPTIVLGPGELESAHSASEHIEIKEIHPAVLIYAQIAIEYCR